MGKKLPIEYAFQFEVVSENEKKRISILDKARYHDLIRGKFKAGDTGTLYIKKHKINRTPSQNNALHKWFELVADELNNAGYTVQIVLKERFDVDWTKDLVKTLLWKTAQKALLEKDSTTDLNKTDDIDQVFEPLNRFLGEKYGIFVGFPSWDDKDEAVLLSEIDK